MRKLMIGTCAALGVALAACDGGTPEAADETANLAGNAAVESPAATQNQLEALSEGERNAVFIRAIQDAGQECQHVDSSARGGEHEGLPVWTARCQGGVEWTIVIGNDGVASVLNPAEAELLGGNQAAAQNAQGE
jgi:hypothetical protein